MSVPCPIVRCENEAVRTQLRKDLYAMGFCRDCLGIRGLLDEMKGNGEWVAIGGSHQQGWPEFPSEGYAMVNSPAHMLSYIRRHGLAPQQAAATQTLQSDD